MAASDAYAELGQVGGQAPVDGQRLRLIAPNGAVLHHTGGATRGAMIDADPFYVQMLDRDDKPVHTFRSKKGIRLRETPAGRWRLKLRTGGGVAPLSPREARDLEKLVRGR